MKIYQQNPDTDDYWPGAIVGDPEGYWHLWCNGHNGQIWLEGPASTWNVRPHEEAAANLPPGSHKEVVEQLAVTGPEAFAAFERLIAHIARLPTMAELRMEFLL